MFRPFSSRPLLSIFQQEEGFLNLPNDFHRLRRTVQHSPGLVEIRVNHVLVPQDVLREHARFRFKNSLESVLMKTSTSSRTSSALFILLVEHRVSLTVFQFSIVVILSVSISRRPMCSISHSRVVSIASICSRSLRTRHLCRFFL